MPFTWDSLFAQTAVCSGFVAVALKCSSEGFPADTARFRPQPALSRGTRLALCQETPPSPGRCSSSDSHIRWHLCLRPTPSPIPTWAGLFSSLLPKHLRSQSQHESSVHRRPAAHFRIVSPTFKGVFNISFSGHKSTCTMQIISIAFHIHPV